MSGQSSLGEPEFQLPHIASEENDNFEFFAGDAVESPTLRLTPFMPETVGEWHIRSCKIEWLGVSETRKKDVLWFKLEAGFAETISPDDCDMFALAMLADAMKAKCALEIRGRVSEGLISNLLELQQVWSHWWDELEPVEIKASGTLRAHPPKEGSVCAFSGGLDAAFTLRQHNKILCGNRSQDIRYAMLVHGFDIAIADEDHFAQAVTQCRASLTDTGVTLVRAASNFRHVSKVKWDFAYGAAVASLLTAFKNKVGAGLIASSHPYGLLRRSGASPVTDHFFGSDSFRVRHDGASHTRTQKADVVGRWHAGRDRLRVCWEDGSDKNCGECEKCIRTSLNFLACGHPIPASLPQSLDLKRMRKITVYTRGRLNMWQELLEESKARGIKAPWQNVARFVVLKSRLRRFLSGDRCTQKSA